MTRGTLNTDSMAIGQLSIDLLRAPIRIYALAALINTKTGQTLAWAKADGAEWSQETMERLRLLKESIEQDMASRIFIETASSGAVELGKGGLQVVGDLAAHLEGDDTPSV